MSADEENMPDGMWRMVATRDMAYVKDNADRGMFAKGAGAGRQ